jgi:hypothetical protein
MGASPCVFPANVVADPAGALVEGRARRIEAELLRTLGSGGGARAQSMAWRALTLRTLAAGRY